MVYTEFVRYLIQHPAGTGELVREALAHYDEDVKITYQDDSAVIFDSSSKPSSTGNAPFVKNAFIVITSVGRGSIDKGVLHLSRSIAKSRFPTVSRRGAGFRTMVHIDGALSAIDPKAKRSLEQAIAAKTGERLKPRGSSEEYWVIGRVDLNQLLFCLRLPKKKQPPKAKGAISYELSNMLVSASRLTSKDVFLDPFGGSGSFVQARLEYPARGIWYSDRGLKKLRPSFAPELARSKRVRFLSEDALMLPSIGDGQVDVIVTDPPWGEHEDISMPYAEFAELVARSFDRVLHPTRGRFVVLASRRTASTFEQSFQAEGFTIRASHEILVSGHPATVFIGGR
jgi:16S rRNA G966 N2-methylase RsmD